MKRVKSRIKLCVSVFLLGFLASCNPGDQEQIATPASPILENGAEITIPVEPAPVSLIGLKSFSATMIYKNYIQMSEENGASIKIEGVPTLSEHPELDELPLCQAEMDKEQPLVGNCSGVLIAPDLILTAGQCFMSEQSCRDFEWVFDYKGVTSNDRSLNRDNIYSCKKIIHVDQREGQDNLAIIQLDRKVTDRNFLPINNEEPTSSIINSVVVGNSFSLSTNVTKPLETLNDSVIFNITADEFFPNPGSALINIDTMRLEGVVIGTGGGFVIDPENVCMKRNPCLDNSCSGTVVNNISILPVDVKGKIEQIMAFGLVELGNLKEIKVLIENGLDPNLRNEYQTTLFLKSVEMGQFNIIDFLLNQKVDLYAIDQMSQNLFHYIVKGNSLETLYFFSGWGMDLDQVDKRGRTPYQLALELGRTEIAEKLIIMGADTNKRPNIEISFIDYCLDQSASDEIKHTVEVLKNRVRKTDCVEADVSLRQSTHLFLMGNELTDLSPISTFKQLTQLDVVSDKIKDLTPLKGLSELIKLRISGDSINDISSLSDLVKLESLKLTGNNIEDFLLIKKNVSLKRLEIKSENIKDLSFLEDLLNLEVLYIVGENVESLNILSSLVNLTEVKVDINQDVDLGIFSNHKKMKKMVLSNNMITDISQLANMLTLERLYLSNNQIKDLSPLSDLKKLKTLSASKNPVEKDELHCPTKGVSKTLSRFCKRNNKN